MNKMSLPAFRNFMLCRCWFWVAAIPLLFARHEARANVYASNLRLNGGTANVNFAGTNILISYILNEPATLGVTVDVLNGTNVVRTLTLTNGGPGALMGTNVVVWDGKDGTGNSVTSAVYNIRVTAGSSHDDWDQISLDGNPGNYVWDGRGIAINKNPASPFFGRVYVSNVTAGPNADSIPGDMIGMLKLNADGSPADEGVFSTGGYPWDTSGFDPWKMEVGGDDRLYVNDWRAQGVLVSFDELISSNSMRLVLRSDNWPGSPDLNGPFISGSGTNMQVWMADVNFGGVGIRRWDIGPGGVIASNDVGTTIVQSGAPSDVDVAPYDVALDSSNNIYTIQNRSTVGDSSPRVLRFPPYDGTNAELVADWKVGTNDTSMIGAFGVAVNPAGSYVAVAFHNVNLGGTHTNGAVRVFSATNGALVAIPTPVPVPSHDYRDVAWDVVGNLYAIDTDDAVWRVYSPPETNFASTVAIGAVVVGGSVVHTPPILSEPFWSAGQFRCRLTGEADVTYILQASSNLVNWAPVATNTSSQASRIITVSAPSSQSFYRALVGQSTAVPSPPTLANPGYGSGQFAFNLLGTANTSYVIQVSTDLQNWSPVATNVSASATRQISVAAPNARGFYRAVVGP